MPKESNKWWRSKVVRGQGKGRTLGFPTANLRPPENFVLKYGIFVARAKLGQQVFDGVLYWGTRGGPPGGGSESLEIHLLDFDDRDLYGEVVKFQIGRFIRDDKKFRNLGRLKAQIDRDVTMVKRMLYG